MKPRTHRERESGQVLALFAFGLLALVTAVAFVVDGGFAFSMQRVSQNASDAAAEAGAVVIAEARAGVTRTDQDVKAAVDGVLGAMELDVAASTAEYTDIDGAGLGVTVGSAPGGGVPAAAYGVRVNGERPFDTFFAQIIGLDQFSADTSATAIAGYGQPAGTSVLPVTPPITIVTCDGQKDPVNTSTKWGKGIVYRVPLCNSGAGNVGWLDWTDYHDGNQGGGKKELKEQILQPNIPPPGVLIPSWHQVAESGNTNSKPVEDALRTYDGDIVLLPLFNAWCTDDPDPNAFGISACPDPNAEAGGGAKLWYHIQEFAAFQLCTGVLEDGVNPVDPDCTDHGAYINGNNSTICDTGNGGTSCLVGKFVDFITGPGYVTGPLDATAGPSDFLTVQLIR